MDKSLFTKYVKEIEQNKTTSEANLRTFLIDFLRSSFPEYTIENEAPKEKETGYGKPDINVRKGEVRIGKIETKGYYTDVKDLVKKALELSKTPENIKYDEVSQIAKYIIDYQNLLVTNFTTFILIQKGKVKTVAINENDIDGSLVNLENIFTTFLNGKLEITNPDDLADKLAILTRKLKNELINKNDRLFREERMYKPNSLFALLEKYVYDKDFEKLSDQERDEDYKKFADDYAQIITYGYLFSRLSKGREIDADEMPLKNTNLAMIEAMFSNVAGDESIVSILKDSRETIDEIIDVVNSVNVEKINEALFSELIEIYKDQKDEIEDPFIYLFETFLKKYDPEKRKTTGSFYTPLPVVKFIVRSIDELLEEDFGFKLGLGNPQVKLLDFATGTGTFLVESYVTALSKYKDTYEALFPKTSDEENKETNNGANNDKTNKEKTNRDLTVRFSGFEIQPSAFMIAQFKLWKVLQKYIEKIPEEKRRKIIPSVYLTDSLDINPNFYTDFSPDYVKKDPGSKSEKDEALKLNKWSYEPKKYTALKDEGKHLEAQLYYMKSMADTVKKGLSFVNVVIGNPPYNSLSDNQSEFIKYLMEYYKEELNEKRAETRNDYVKFIRLAHYIINKNGYGIIGIITDNSFLDGVTLKVMRKKLFQDFNKIYIINLHGDMRKGEQDENIFDIKVGNCIVVFEKLPYSNKHEVYYYSTLKNGIIKRKDKFDLLAKNTLKTLKNKLKKINPTDDMFYFVDLEEDKNYKANYSIDKIFNLLSSGILTAFDPLFVDFNKDRLISKMKMFFRYYNKDISMEEILKDTNISKIPEYFKYEEKRESFIKTFNENNIKKILYRPFDIRYIYYDHHLITTSSGRPRYEIMKHMLNGNNLALVSTRQTSQENTVTITKYLIDFNITPPNRLFPLKLFEGDKSTSNISQDFINLLKQLYKSIEITDEKAFYYVVGLLSSNAYFNKYKEQMRQDFPHVVLVKDAETFEKVAELGKKLSDEIADFDELKLPSNFSVQTNIEKIPDTKLQFTYDEKTKTLYLTRDKSLWIKGIEKEVFEFKQGNFNVIENWLKSRKGLDFDNEMLHSFNVVCYAVERYLQIRKELDKVLEGKI